MHPTESHANASGVRIHYRDHGGQGPPLILVHATGFHGRLWDPYLPALTERFRVVTIDQRGHGDSDKPEAGYEWENFGLDALAVVDALRLDRPAGVGHSSGAAALVLAEARRPGTFSRLALLDPVTPPPELRRFFAGQENPLSAAARKRRAIWDSREQMLERLRTNSPMAPWREEFREAYVNHGVRDLPDGRVELKCPPAAEAQVYEMGGNHAGWEGLASLRCPAVLVAGANSDMWFELALQRAAQQIAGGCVETVSGAGHFFPMENPEGTLRVVLPFLDQTGQVEFPSGG